MLTFLLLYSLSTATALLLLTLLFMSKLSEQGARLLSRIEASERATLGIQADIAFLKLRIQELQNSTGEISPGDQAILDEIEARLNGLSDRLTAQDAETTPPPTPEPTPEPTPDAPSA